MKKVHIPHTMSCQKKKIRRAFIYTEVLIGIVLLSIIVSSVFGLLSFGSYTLQKIEQQSVKLDRKKHAYNRLKELFLSIKFNIAAIDKSLFEADKNKIVFCYDGGVDRDPYFSSDPIGVLTVMQNSVGKKSLMLYSYPNNEKFAKKKDSLPSRWEIILDDISSCTYSFFSLDTKKFETVWDRGKFPLLVKIEIILQNDEHLDMCFPIGTSCCKVEYPS